MRKIFVAGCDSIASATWPYRASTWAFPWKPSTIGLFDFLFSVTAVVSCGNRCKLANSSNTNQVLRFVDSSFINRKTSRSSHRLTSGRILSRIVAFDVRKTHPLRSFAHSTVFHRRVVSDSLGSSLNASATIFNEPRTPLRWFAAPLSIIAASSVPSTRLSISSALLIQ